MKKSITIQFTLQSILTAEEVSVVAETVDYYEKSRKFTFTPYFLATTTVLILDNTSCAALSPLLRHFSH